VSIVARQKAPKTNNKKETQAWVQTQKNGLEPKLGLLQPSLKQKQRKNLSLGLSSYNHHRATLDIESGSTRSSKNGKEKNPKPKFEFLQPSPNYFRC